MVFGLVGIAVALIAIAGLVGVAFDNAACHARWTDRNVKFGVMSGCLVEAGGKFVPEDRVWFERNQ
jgi:hypothetical protein